MIVGNRHEDGGILELGIGTIRQRTYSAVVTNTSRVQWAKVDVPWLLVRDVWYSVVGESLFWSILKMGWRGVMYEMVVATCDRKGSFRELLNQSDRSWSRRVTDSAKSFSNASFSVCESDVMHLCAPACRWILEQSSNLELPWDEIMPSLRFAGSWPRRHC